MFFYGALSAKELGHYWYNSALQHLWKPQGDMSGPIGCPWRSRDAGGIGLDGTIAPRSPTPTNVDKIGLMRSGYEPPSYEVPQGLCAHLIHDGWTVISFWDRSADRRGACNSAFVVHEVVRDFDEMTRRAKETFPTIYARFPFTLHQLNFNET
jgi:hypothetical protein